MPPGKEVSAKTALPLSYVVADRVGENPGEPIVIFSKNQPPEVRFGEFIFSGGILNKSASNLPGPIPEASIIGIFPVYSILAVVMLILFRNLFFSTFQNYFLSIRNNFEIDFNIQKIGVMPVLTALLIIFFSLLDFFRLSGSPVSMPALASVQFVFYPMGISAAAIFFFAASLRVFPVIFPDIKVLFMLSLLLLLINFTLFSRPDLIFPYLDKLPFFLVSAYLLYRSILFFGVFVKYYRFYTKLSLFYICGLNLATCLILHKILS